jgi:hypothetical protein
MRRFAVLKAVPRVHSVLCGRRAWAGRLAGARAAKWFRGRRIGGRRFLVVKTATWPEYGLLVHDPAVWVSVLDGLDRLPPE